MFSAFTQSAFFISPGFRDLMLSPFVITKGSSDLERTSEPLIAVIKNPLHALHVARATESYGALSAMRNIRK
jgi:hypothetical protein